MSRDRGPVPLSIGSMTSKSCDCTCCHSQSCVIFMKGCVCIATLRNAQSSRLAPETLHALQPVPSPGSPEHLILRRRHRTHCIPQMSVLKDFVRYRFCTYRNCDAFPCLAANGDVYGMFMSGRVIPMGWAVVMHRRQVSLLTWYERSQ